MSCATSFEKKPVGSAPVDSVPSSRSARTSAVTPSSSAALSLNIDGVVSASEAYETQSSETCACTSAVAAGVAELKRPRASSHRRYTPSR